MAELQLRLPYTAWGTGDEWQEGYEDLLGELFEAVTGVGDADDPDHFDDFICFYLDGDNVEELRRVAREVLSRHNLLGAVSAMVTDPDAGDMYQGTVITL